MARNLSLCMADCLPVLEVLRERPGLTPREISNAVPALSLQAVRGRLRWLSEQGKVYAMDRGSARTWYPLGSEN